MYRFWFLAGIPPNTVMYVCVYTQSVIPNEAPHSLFMKYPLEKRVAYSFITETPGSSTPAQLSRTRFSVEHTKPGVTLYTTKHDSVMPSMITLHRPKRKGILTSLLHRPQRKGTSTVLHVTHTHAHTYMCTHTHMHAHAHIHTHMQLHACTHLDQDMQHSPQARGSVA